MTDREAMKLALEALELLRIGVIQMRKHAESYGEAWARAYVKEYRDLLPGAAEEQFRSLNVMQHRMADVAESIVKGYDAITALRQALEQPEQPYKGIADRMYRETNGRMRIDPVTGDVGVGSPSEQPEQPQFFYGQDPNVLSTHDKGDSRE